jgi:hypothetical protein
MQLAIVLSWTWRGSKSLKAAQRGARVGDPSTTLGFGPFSKHGALSLPPTTFGPQNRAPYNQVSVPICTKALPRELPGLGPLSTGTTLPRKGGGAPGAPMPAPRPTRPGTAPGRPPPPVGISDVTRQASTLQQRRRHGPRRAARAHWWVAGCPPAHPRGPGARPSGALVPVARAGPAPWHPNAGRAVKAPERRRAARAACRRLAHWACKARVVLLHLARAALRRAAPRRAAPRRVYPNAHLRWWEACAAQRPRMGRDPGTDAGPGGRLAAPRGGAVWGPTAGHRALLLACFTLRWV